MKLISEEVQNAEYLVEEKNGKKEYKIRGVFLQSEIKNRNGRVYPQEIMVREVNRYTKEFINKNRAFGELGHPDGPTVNLERVCHMVKSLKQDGKDFIGEAKIMDTPYGKIVKGLIDEGAQLGVSSRGMGSLVQRGGMNVVSDDFYIATAADIVADPSAPDAFVEGIMEGKEWICNNGLIKEAEIAQMRDNIEENAKQDNSKANALEFAKFLQKL